MILTGSEIEKEVISGAITIKPFSRTAINPNSYNYRLGNLIYEINDRVIDPRKKAKTTVHKLTKNGFVLLPNRLYLGHTAEVIGSSRYVTSLIGRSSVGRLGLYLQITADLGQLGAAHQWTLELKTVQPLRVYPGMKIGQISFWETEGEIQPHYNSGYTNFNTPEPSKLHEEAL